MREMERERKEGGRRESVHPLTRLSSLLAAPPSSRNSSSQPESERPLSLSEREELQRQIETLLVKHLTAAQSEGRAVAVSPLSPADEAVEREHVFSELSRECVKMSA